MPGAFSRYKIVGGDVIPVVVVCAVWEGGKSFLEDLEQSGSRGRRTIWDSRLELDWEA
jgi:hypothetical protein